MSLPPNFYLGTSSWTAKSWNGVFYPKGTPSSEYLLHYSRRFRAVEIDSTWYREPAPKTVEDWNRKTPDGFVFAAKVPQTITHAKLLLDCEAELESFVGVMRRLGPKLGPLLLQFPYFKRDSLPGLDAFLERLVPFLFRLPEDVRFAVEVRNKGWLQPALFDVLRDRRVALAWIDHPWMPTAKLYGRISGAVTTDFLYVRWLGDRYKIEEVTKSWDRLVYERTRETAVWAEVLTESFGKVSRNYAFYNNHYAGSAFRSASLFEEAWDTQNELSPGGAAEQHPPG